VGRKSVIDASIIRATGCSSMCAPRTWRELDQAAGEMGFVVPPTCPCPRPDATALPVSATRSIARCGDGPQRLRPRHGQRDHPRERPAIRRTRPGSPPRTSALQLPLYKASESFMPRYRPPQRSGREPSGRRGERRDGSHRCGHEFDQVWQRPNWLAAATAAPPRQHTRTPAPAEEIRVRARHGAATGCTERHAPAPDSVELHAAARSPTCGSTSSKVRGGQASREDRSVSRRCGSWT
jgi:hypothetical protein